MRGYPRDPEVIGQLPHSGKLSSIGQGTVSNLTYDLIGNLSVDWLPILGLAIDFKVSTSQHHLILKWDNFIILSSFMSHFLLLQSKI